MNLTDYTTEAAFLPHLKCADLTGAVRELVGTLAADGVTGDPEQLVDDILRREREGSTAVGGGLVIPHARSSAVTRVRLAVATLAEPLAVGAADGRPADVVLLLVGPMGDPRLMLRVLARMARLVRQRTLLDDLRAAADADSLRQALAGADQA